MQINPSVNLIKIILKKKVHLSTPEITAIKVARNKYNEYTTSIKVDA